jgi:putative DNA-invertase from lambdoid prophage Rac
VSVIAMNGMTFNLSSPHGRMLATFFLGIAEFERDLISERVKYGMGRSQGTREDVGPTTGAAPQILSLGVKNVLALAAEGRSYRLISRELGLSKNTVADIVHRNRDAIAACE